MPGCRSIRLVIDGALTSGFDDAGSAMAGLGWPIVLGVAACFVVTPHA